MTIIPLLLDPGAQARTILHHLMERGDVAGSDAVGRTVITFAVDDWLLERLLTFDADSEDLEGNGDIEDDGEAEPEDCPVVLTLDLVPVRRICRRRS